MSSIVNLVYELPHQLPNDLRFRFLGSQEISEKSQIWMETQLSTQSPFNKLALVVVVEKKHVKIDTNFLFSCPVLRDFSILFQIIFPGLYVTQIFYPLKIFISLYFPEKTNLVSTQPIFFIFLHKNKYLRLEFV